MKRRGGKKKRGVWRSKGKCCGNEEQAARRM